MILYTQGYDNLDVDTDYGIGGTITFGPDGVSGSISGGVSNQPIPCGSPGGSCPAGAGVSLSMPMIIIAVVVVILLIRR